MDSPVAVSSTFANLVPLEFPAVSDSARLEPVATVLVVDASPVFRQAVKSVLEGVGYRVQSAGSADEALRLASGSAPDAVMVDLALPGASDGARGADGVRFVQRLRREPYLQRVPCLVLSGSDDGEDEVRALEAGADDFIIKSDGFLVLRHRLRAHLRRYRAEQQWRRDEQARHRRDIERLQASAKRQLDEARSALLNVVERQTAEITVLRSVAEQANESAAALLASMAGEVRGPLRDVVGYSDLLLRELFGPLGARQKEYVRNIQSGSRQAMGLISDLLDVSRIETGQITLTRTHVAPGRLVEAVCGVLQPSAKAVAVDVALELQAALPDVHVDATRTRQALHSLLGTLLRTARPGTTLKVRAAIEGEGVEIKAERPGPVAAPPSEQNTSDTRPPSLGLVLTRKLAELHGGRLELIEGETVSARLWLPCR